MINKIGKPSEDQYGYSSPDLPTQSLPQDELLSTAKGIYDILTLHVNAMRNTQSPTPQRGEMAFKERLAKRCDTEMESFDSNILDSFRKLYQIIPACLLMEVVLAIQYIRAFSALSTILTKLRTKLSKKSLSNLLITKLNFEFLNFSTLDV
ncbi:PREDICTED: uncharacterized protein LOC108367775 [Rhagoletis zephyria]|uniref:uncharacterized protein LOC108367775 n=1 Tax=Rhagoletis zephyria TaxID=28612 RepID=UPI0008116E2B|nr:PREDICTED: uncharacterized protein LOC108367775 [Rhagoletis zephyria]